MIRDLRRSFKLLKYEKGMLYSLVALVMFLALGLFFILYLKTIFLGGFYLFMSQMLIPSVYGLLQSSMILSSPHRSFLETWLPDILQLGGAVICYGIIVLISVMQIYANPGLSDQYKMEIVMFGVTAATMIIYIGTSHKMFIPGIVLFAVTFIMSFYEVIDIQVPKSMGISVLVSFMFILAGCMAAAVLRRFFYRKPVKKRAAGVELR